MLCLFPLCFGTFLKSIPINPLQTRGNVKARKVPNPQPHSNTNTHTETRWNRPVCVQKLVFTEGNGVVGPTALGGLGSVVWPSIVCERAALFPQHWGTCSCLMPFKQTQTLFGGTVPKYGEIKQRGRTGAGKAAGHPSRTRRGTFVRMSANSSVSLIHGQRLLRLRGAVAFRTRLAESGKKPFLNSSFH